MGNVAARKASISSSLQMMKYLRANMKYLTPDTPIGQAFDISIIL